MRHKNAKNKRDQVAKRAVGDVVEAIIDGKVVSWVNEYAGPAAATNARSSDTSALKQEKVVAVTPKASTGSNNRHPSHQAPALPSATGSADFGPKSGIWTQQAYYNADDGTAKGLTFLNHFGGTKGIPGTAAGGPALVIGWSTFERD